MSAVSIEITAQDVEVERYLKKLSRNGLPILPLIKNVGEEVRDQTVARFSSQKGPDGQAWIPSQRAKEDGPKGKTLVDKRNLKDIHMQIVGVDALVGTDQPYGAIHQFGGEAGRNKSVTLPARPFLGINEQNTRDINSEVADYMANVL